MDPERISVVVPAYNTAAWLAGSLDSLLAQTYANLEVIVVNDGSTDDTRQVLDAYRAQHPQVKVIHQENGGVTAARMRGVQAASGDWIGFLDGDDLIEPWMYQRLLDNAHAHQAQISHCGHLVQFPDGRISYVHNTGQLRIQQGLTGVLDLLDGSMVESSLCTKLFRRELFLGLEAFLDPSITINEDYLMNYYLFAQTDRAVFEDVCPYRYQLRPGSASYRVLHEHSIFDPIRVRHKILEHCVPELKEATRQALLRNCLFAYAQLAVNRERQYDGYRTKVRALLREQKEYFPLLSVRNRILANMICLAPWSFTLAYRAYVALFQREEEH